MRRSSPQHHQTTSRGSDKPSSPRLTLRFQQVKGRDTRHGGGVSKASEVSSSEPRYQSYCVTMETGEESAQQTSKRDDLDESGRGGGGRDSQLNVVSSSKDNSNAGDPLLMPESGETVHKSSEVNYQHETNGDGSELKSGDAAGSDGEQDDNKRKRRRDGDSSPTFSATSPRHFRDEGSGQSQNSTNIAASSVRTSEPESTHSDIDNSDDGCLKVPPLKIVIPTNTSNEKLVSRSALPYVVVPSSCTGDLHGSSASGGGGSSGVNEDSGGKDREEERSHRVTRSSQRMQAALANSGANGLSSSSNSAASVTQDHSPSAVNETVNVSGSEEHQQGGNEAPTHRKRKLRSKDGPSSSGSTSSSSSSHGEEQPALNCYEMYLNIRKQIDRRRMSMFVVQPKPPQGFKDYLMNRCSYILAGNAASRLSVPMIPPPQSLGGAMRDLFVSQEKERYNLRLQHQIEKEKLVLMVEQEILRVHGRAARAMANQTVPLSVCTVLKDEEVYSQLEPEQDERERNARTRFTGRHLLSWLQDIDDKWDKVKEAMLLRHHNEAESLHAAQILDWEWKMKELGLCDNKTAPVADAIHVPMVHVSPSILASNGEVGSAVVKNSSFRAASGT